MMLNPAITSISIRADRLRRSEIFGDLADADLLAIAEFCTEERYGENEIVLAEGAQAGMHTLTVGPQLSYRKNRSTVPFLHALFGVAHAIAGFQDLAYSSSSFAMSFGGGMDWAVRQNVAIRVIQVDVMVTYLGENASTDGRVSAGIVFRFGSK